MLEFIARQFRRPSGLLGHLVGRFMNRANARFTAGAIEALDPGPQDHVLEIGFGGGVGLRRLLSTVRQGQGTISGTELSDVMLSQAETRFADAIRQDRLRLAHAAVEQLPFDDATFAGVLTVNTVYFWSDLEQGASEVLRVLRPGGRLVLGIRPPEDMRRLPLTRHGFTLREPEALEETLRQAGFTKVRSETHEDGRWGYICVVADKPA